MTGDFSLRVKFSLVGEGAQPVTLVAQQSERAPQRSRGQQERGAAAAARGHAGTAALRPGKHPQLQRALWAGLCVLSCLNAK